ncbi:hypothetical protein DYB28_010636 [Aphanomyces astaci]|uniref:Uncharacterized protein n=1 Tax=Aphanomyces astaci TaxID=112090 RepID=A0A9X8ECE5_APHAT|nr:hypothetical protein DYB28_010636 [Aphanomyces astaci]
MRWCCKIHANGSDWEAFALDVDTRAQPVVHHWKRRRSATLKRRHTSCTTDDAHSPDLAESVLEMVIVNVDAQGYLDHTGEKNVIVLLGIAFDVDLTEVSAFSSCGSHSWANNVGKLTSKFLENTCLDGDMLFKRWRRPHWRLPHSADDGIMSRGFDDMNCEFSVHQAKYLDEGDEDKVNIVPSISLLSHDGSYELQDGKGGQIG